MPESRQTEATAQPPLDDEDAAKRQALIGQLRDDRQDLVRVANVVRDLAETLEVAQGSLTILSRVLRWAALVGGVAALTISVRRRKPAPTLMLTGLSLFMAYRWVSHPVRHELVAPSAPHRPEAAHPRLT